MASVPWLCLDGLSLLLFVVLLFEVSHFRWRNLEAEISCLDSGNPDETQRGPSNMAGSGPAVIGLSALAPILPLQGCRSPETPFVACQAPPQVIP